MRIASTLVQSSGRPGPNYHRNSIHGGDCRGRLRLFLQCVEAAEEEGCQVLLFPAGFFCVRSARVRKSLEQELAASLASSTLLVAVGIDESGPGRKRRIHKSNSQERDGYPYYGYLIENGQFLVRAGRQTSISTDEVGPDRVDPESRRRVATSTALGGRSVALSICGELLSTAWRDAYARLRPTLLLHPAHASVQLGGKAKESWGPKLEELVCRLPTRSAWAFADHVMGLAHSNRGRLEPLVRRGGGSPGKRVVTRDIEADHKGRMYVYEV